MEQILDNRINIRFISTNDINYWAELKSLENGRKIIPLLLTKEEAIETLIKLKELDVTNFPFNYIYMIVSGCMMTIIRRLHC